MKNGVFTTEFWVTVIVNVVAATVALLAAYGLLTEKEGEVWVELARALVLMIAPIVMAYTSVRYTQARTNLKLNGG